MEELDQSTQDIATMVDHELSFAKSVISKGDKYQMQITFLGYEGGKLSIFPVVGLGFLLGSDEKKRTIRKMVKALWYKISSEHPGVELLAVLLTADTYIERPNKEEFEKLMRYGREKPFEPKPGMAEAVIVMVYDGKEERQYQWPYMRGKEEIVFAEAPTSEVFPQSPRAFLSGLWPL